MTLGGISKASKGINLSEDIFGGFNFVLRGGEATQAEYIQVMERWRGDWRSQAFGWRGDTHGLRARSLMPTRKALIC